MPRDHALVSMLSGIITLPADPTQIPYFNVNIKALRNLFSVETRSLTGARNGIRFDHGDLAIGQNTYHVHIVLTQDGSGIAAKLTPDPSDSASIFIAAGGNGEPGGTGLVPENGCDARVDARQGESLGIACGGHGVRGRSGSIPPRPDHGKPGGNGGSATVIMGDDCAVFASSGNGGTGGTGSLGAVAQAAVPGPRPPLWPRSAWWALTVISAFAGQTRPALPASPGGNAGDGGSPSIALIMVGESSFAEAVGGLGGRSGIPGAAAPGGTAPAGAQGTNGSGGSVEVHYGVHSQVTAVPGRPGGNTSGTAGTTGARTLTRR
jgi:hypothetical protein